jgi:hypothetical protein
MKLFKGKQDQGGIAVAESEIAPAETLDQVQADLDDIAGERARLEDESRTLAGRLAEIAAQVDEAKVQMASCGGSSGTSALNARECERREITSRREGIQILVERLAARQAPLQSRARTLAGQADLERQDAEVVAFQKKAELLSKQVIDHWRRACSEAFELTSFDWRSRRTAIRGTWP